MSLKNKVILIGNLGKDPEIRAANEKKVATFGMATSDKYKDRNGNTVEDTQWHSIVAWSPFAELIEKYVKKGSKIGIEGQIKYRSYDDNQGIKRYVTEIVVRELLFLDSKPQNTAAPAQSPTPAAAMPAATNTPNTTDDIDDLPF